MLKDYLEGLITQIIEEFRTVERTYDADAIHDMRVNIKRLRAVMDFIHFTDPDFDKKTSLQSFRLVFKRVGVIRDIQVPLSIIAALNDEYRLNMTRFVNRLRKKEKKEIHATVDWLHDQQIDFQTSRHQILEKARKVTVNEKQAQAFLNELLIRLRPDKSRYRARAWHKKRVTLKKYHHVKDAFADIGIIAITDSELKLIRISETLMGDWHDRIMVLEHLREWELEESPLASIVKRQERYLKRASKFYMKRLVAGEL